MHELKPLTNRQDYFAILLSLAVISLSLTYIMEYIFGIMGCPLCIYERFPYLLLIAFCIYAIAANKYEFRYIITVLAVGAVISFYHSGVERGFFATSGLCKPAVSLSENLSLVEMQAILSYQTMPSCDKVAFSILGLSLTEWNLLINLALLVITFYVRSNAKTKLR